MFYERNVFFFAFLWKKGSKFFSISFRCLKLLKSLNLKRAFFTFFLFCFVIREMIESHFQMTDNLWVLLFKFTYVSRDRTSIKSTLADTYFFDLLDFSESTKKKKISKHRIKHHNGRLAALLDLLDLLRIGTQVLTNELDAILWYDSADNLLSLLCL